MRRTLIGAVIGMAVLAAPVAAQDKTGNYRHFHENPFYENNGNGRIIYAPLVASHSGPGRVGMPYGYPVADWAQQRPGARNVGPDSRLDDGTYTLERFEAVHHGDAPVFRVVITRTPLPPEGTAPPELRVLDQQSQISSAALASVETTGNGVRYTFMVRPPLFALASDAAEMDRLASGRYELRLAPARDVPRPRYIAGAPTFGGESVEVRMQQGPPRLPREERVAGKRIEYRSANDPGRVIQETVAGRRQERRE